jgi:hypothetical protein
MNFAMDLTPLVTDAELDPLDHALAHVERFRAEVEARIGRMRGS